ncbi:MAG TPA: hypothetical protein PLE30_05715 [Candidatus Kapabacteria bacterium]|nr:hypothetical protein [Candidatus Kapabacteria bacterium]
MKYLSRLLIIIALPILFIACNKQEDSLDSKIYDQKFTAENIQDLIKQVANDKGISREKMDILTAGITRLAALKRDTIVGKTLNDVIKIEEDFLRQRSIATLNAQGVKVNLVHNHEFKFVGLMPRDTMDKSFNLLVIEITNKGKKEMTNIQGTLQFFEPSGQVVKSYPIAIKNALKGAKIASGETKRLVIPYSNDKNNVRDVMMRNDIKNMSAVWVASMIEWADGSQISIQAATDNAK